MNETNHPSSLATCTLIQDFLSVKDGGIYEAVVQLKQQLDAVVAECATQKGVIDAVVAVANQSHGISGWHLNGDVAGWEEILPEIYDIETPNVTAALAEVEAKAIEKFAAQQEKLAADYRKLSPGCYGEKSSAENALMARAFAVELREGRV
jgi:hypothetical protein